MFGTCAVLKSIGEERRRQVKQGHTPKRDAAVNGRAQLAMAATALLDPYSKLVDPPELVLYYAEMRPRLDRRSQLIQAAALIVAEVERLDYEAYLRTHPAPPEVLRGETMMESMYRKGLAVAEGE